MAVRLPHNRSCGYACARGCLRMGIAEDLELGHDGIVAVERGEEEYVTLKHFVHRRITAHSCAHTIGVLRQRHMSCAHGESI